VGNKVEILISDNCSSDDTSAVVGGFVSKGLPIRYIRNSENFGSDSNIAQCFNYAAGRYVLILGDDDVLVDGALPWLVERLSGPELGVLCMRPYGFDRDFREEHPGGSGKELMFGNGGDFLAEIGPMVTLISACIINKGLLDKVDANDFCGGNLVQVHLVIRAALAARQSVFVNRYMVACKRNNSGGYEFSRVFVEELGRILDQYRSMGLSPESIRSFETRTLLGYYPYYLLRQRMARGITDNDAYLRIRTRFGDRWLFRILLAPILSWPRPLAIIWGACATLAGRMAIGDTRRGAMFAWNRLRQLASKPRDTDR
jgi:glycosyltransferase involved in cell wall biosynthesis